MAPGGFKTSVFRNTTLPENANVDFSFGTPSLTDLIRAGKQKLVDFLCITESLSSAPPFKHVLHIFVSCLHLTAYQFRSLYRKKYFVTNYSVNRRSLWLFRPANNTLPTNTQYSRSHYYFTSYLTEVHIFLPKHLLIQLTKSKTAMVDIEWWRWIILRNGDGGEIIYNNAANEVICLAVVAVYIEFGLSLSRGPPPNCPHGDSNRSFPR